MLPVTVSDSMCSAPAGVDESAARTELFSLIAADPPVAATPEEADLLCVARVFVRLFRATSALSDAWPLFSDFPGQPSLFKHAVRRHVARDTEWEALLGVTDDEVALAANLARFLCRLGQRVPFDSLTFVSAPAPSSRVLAAAS